MFTVYALVDPRDLRIRYVGCIAASRPYVRSRLRTHLAEARKGRSTSPKCRWLRELLAIGLTPAACVLETIGHDAVLAAESERRWIAWARDVVGPDLTNVQPGSTPAQWTKPVVFGPRPRWSAERRAAFIAALPERDARGRHCFHCGEAGHTRRQCPTRRKAA